MSVTRLLTLTAVVLSVHGAALPSRADILSDTENGGIGAPRADTAEVDLLWTASPLVDSDGQPLAEAIRYRLYATQNGGPEAMLVEVNNDTTCTVTLNCNVTYRIRVIGYDEAARPSVPSEWSDPIVVDEDGGLTDVDGLPAGGTAIESTYPNPFNPSIRIRFAVDADLAGETVRVDILDVRGRVVKNLLAAAATPGHHEVAWQGVDETGRAMPSGTYFVRLLSHRSTQVKAITLLK